MPASENTTAKEMLDVFEETCVDSLQVLRPHLTLSVTLSQFLFDGPKQPIFSIQYIKQKDDTTFDYDSWFCLDMRMQKGEGCK